MPNLRSAAGPPIQRWVEASAICYSIEPAPAGLFEVRVDCYAKRSFEFWRRSDNEQQDEAVQEYTAGTTTETFVIGGLADLAALLSADACRDTLRGMLLVLPQLQALRLTEDEWDAVVPGNIVPAIVDTASRADGFIFSFVMRARLRVTHDERALLLACKEWLAPTASGEKDCPICVDGLEQEAAVVLPGCTHAFHRQCISDWFPTSATCPTCRDNVWKSALPFFIELLDLE